MHDRELEFYCRGSTDGLQCEKVICAKGLTKEHNGHDIVDIEEELEERKKIVENTIKDVGDATDKVSKLSDKTENRYKKITKEIEKLRKKSKDEIDRLLDDFQLECKSSQEKDLEGLLKAWNQLDQYRQKLKDISNKETQPGSLPDMDVVQNVKGDLGRIHKFSKQLSKSIRAANDTVDIRMEIVKSLGRETTETHWSFQPKINKSASKCEHIAQY